MPEEYVPDTLSKFSSFREALDRLSNLCNEELGERHKITFELELLHLRMVDICDDVELLIDMQGD